MNDADLIIQRVKEADMAKDQNQGQQKPHEATRTNPTTGEVETRTFTQEEWRNRDKTEGWTRPDEAEGDTTDEGSTE
jgi:hypothetical protein